MKRRGSIIDLIGIMLVVVAVTFVFFLTAVVGNAAEVKFNSSIAGGMTPLQTQMFADSRAAIDILIDSIPFIVFAFAIGAIVLAFLIPSHPVFLPIALLFIALSVILASIYSNVMWAFVNDSNIVAVANLHPMAITVIRFLPHIIAIIGFTLCIAMYSRGSSGSQGSGII